MQNMYVSTKRDYVKQSAAKDNAGGLLLMETVLHEILLF